MKWKLYIVFACSVTLFPMVTFAQAAKTGDIGPLGSPYVPVYDQTTNSNFVDYISNFNDQFGDKKPDGTTDSLRDLIAGENPGGIAATLCIKGDNLEGFPNEAYAYSSGPWATASAETGIPTGIPAGASANSGPYVQINYSHSLRCLLQETVEWQKLGLSLQIHSLLKTYIADAQTKQLNNQLKNKIASANLDWSRAGNEVNDGGVLTTQPVFSTNISQSKYNEGNRQLEHITDQVAADPTSGNPVGSLGIAAPWRLSTAATMVKNNHGLAEDPFYFDENATQEQLSSYLEPTDFGKFMNNFNDPANKLSGMETFDAMLSNRANSPLGVSTLASQIAARRINSQKETTAQNQTSSGFVPASQCSGNASDPYCLNQQFSRTINPAGQNQQVVTDNSSQGDRQVEQGDALDAKGGPAAQVQSTVLNTQGGLLAYDTTPLATSSTVVNKLIKELYDTMYIGYFGVQPETSQWAQATLMMIYDEMKFNATEPETVVTNAHDPVPTGY